MNLLKFVFAFSFGLMIHLSVAPVFKAPIHSSPSGSSMDELADMCVSEVVSDHGSSRSRSTNARPSPILEKKSLLTLLHDKNMQPGKKESLFFKCGQALARFHQESIGYQRSFYGRLVDACATMHGDAGVSYFFVDEKSDEVSIESVNSDPSTPSVDQKCTVSNDLFVFVFAPLFCWSQYNLTERLPNFEKCMSEFLVGYVQSYPERHRRAIANYVKTEVFGFVDVAHKVAWDCSSRKQRIEMLQKDYFDKRPQMPPDYFDQESGLWTAFIQSDCSAGVVERLFRLRCIVAERL